jgi:hypothetical protein
MERLPFAGPSAWYGREFVDSQEWIHVFTKPEIAELTRAVAHVRQRRLPIEQISRDDFVLPRLGPLLQRIQDDVVNGRGFVLFRGLPVERVTRAEAATAYWGIGLYFGWPVSQNAKGHLLGHVRDIGLDPNDPNHRIYATSARHLYHTDSCDIVGLLCLRPAKLGGSSSIASSVTIYNEMLAARPDLVEALEQPFFVDRKGEIPAGKGPHYRMAVFHRHAGYLTTIYARDFIECAQRFDDVPPLTPQQVEALDMLDALAGRDDVRLDMQLRPGDIQFLHNHQLLHARTAYEDYPEPERKRHLLRLWLAPPNGRPLPAVFAERYGGVEPGRRGGIRVPGMKLNVPLEAE